MQSNENESLAGNLRRHVTHLAGHIGERHMWRTGSLAMAAEYVEAQFTAAGYAPLRQTFRAYGMPVCNLVARKEGGAGKILVIGAHYDSVPGSPGADDNASAVAGLLELARLARSSPTLGSLQFAAFVNEESPAFGTDYMGSLQFARQLKQSNARVAGMVCLEMIGYFDRNRRQRYPMRLMRLFYPARADFIGVVSDLNSWSFALSLTRAMRRAKQLRVTSLMAPLPIGGTDRSDHSSFWRYGFKAAMVTDTAQFRNPNYHRETDTADTLDYDGMARVVRALHGALLSLSIG